MTTVKVYLNTRSACLTALAAGLAAPAAYAQEAGLEEIVVTAQHRQERLQDVPIAIAAIGGESLQDRGVKGIDDLGTAVSGLTMNRGGSKPMIYLRGIGTAGNNIGQDPAVTMFVDGVYQPSAAAADMPLNDLERVEVLKGPQGTLFGRNSTGGVVSIITKDPSTGGNSFAGELGYGNYQTFRASGSANLAYSDTVAQNISVLYEDQGKGWGRNVTTGKEVNIRDVFAIRSKLKFDLGATRIVLAGDYAKQKGDLGAAYRNAYNSSMIFYGPNLPGGFYDTAGNFDPATEVKNYGGSLTVRHDLGFAEITSISAYRKTFASVATDIDTTPLSTYEAGWNEYTKQFTQEFQLASTGSGPFKWQMGVYYLNATYLQDPLSQVGAFVGPGIAFVTIAEQKLESIAGYVQGTYSFTDSTRLTLGFRYTNDKRKFNATNYTTPLNPADPLSADGVLTQAGPSVAARDSTGKPTWRVVLDQDLGPDVMAYASYNRGFKSGSFNATSIYDPILKPEILDAYEVGIKSTLLNNRIRLNAAGFYYKYDNMQLSQVSGAAQLLLNAGSAELYGLDADFEFAATDRLNLSGGMTILHAEFTEFRDAPLLTPRTAPPYGNEQTSVDAAGKNIPQAPRFSANAAVSYTIPVGYGDVRLDANYAYHNGFYWIAANRTKQRALSLVNASVAWNAPEDKWTVRAWVKNLTDEKYYSQVSEAGFGDFGAPAAPRTYGISVGFKY